jgi:serine/threonine protein kinase
MAYFFTLPSGARQSLISYFSNKPSGTKLKYGFALDRVSSNLKNSNGYILENSYIKLGKDIYAMGRGKEAYVGKGAFGTVKHVRSLSTGTGYVVKKQSYKLNDSKLKFIENEVQTLFDQGLLRDVGVREGAWGTKQYGTNKHYIVMLNAGTPLNKSLVVQPSLSTAVRFDTTIKLCWAVHAMHQGISSRTGTPYVHRDLKPANIALANAGEVRLVDMGLCQTNPDQRVKDFSGAPAYLPNVLTLLKRPISLRQMDVLALKRVIYMPDKMICSEGYIEDNSGKHFNCPMVFSQALLKASGLFTYFDTSATTYKQNILDQESYQGDPLTLCSLSVLGKYGLVNQYAQSVIKNKTLAYAVLGLYFANQDLPDERITYQIDSSIKAYALCKVAPKHMVSAERTKLLGVLVAEGITKNLNLALSDNGLIALIKESTVLVKQAVVLLWQNDFHDPASLNKLKGNDLLAKKVIQLIFDGDLTSVNSALLTPQKELVTVRKVAVHDGPKRGAAVPFCLPQKLRLPVLPLKKVTEKAQNKPTPVDIKLPSIYQRQSSSLFFTPARETRIPAYKDAVKHAYPWRI